MNTRTESFLKLIESICRQRDLAINEKNLNFNIFKVMGMQTDEVKLHSTFLAELLNPKGSHGMGHLFLIEFINKCSFIDKVFDTSKVDVEVEKYVGEIPESKETGGRLDIFITDRIQSIIIENKIYAPDQEKQLVRYHNYNPNAYIIYLTLDGHTPTNDSACDLEYSNHYHCISYEKDIVEWLEQCLTAVREKPLFYNTLLQYINTIKELTNQSLIPAMDKVLSAAIKNNIEASIEIEKAMPNIRNEFHREFWEVLVNELRINPLKAISALPNWKNYDEIVRYEIENRYEGEILIFRLRLSEDSGIYMGITTKDESICKDSKFRPIIAAFTNWESVNGSAHIVWKSIGLNFWKCDSRTISYMQSDEKERKSFISDLAIEINLIKEQLTDLCAKS